MSRTLAELLEQPPKSIAKPIEQLEVKNGYPSHDVRAAALNIQKVRQKIAELKLDPDDTTPSELYHALLLRFQADSRRFDEHFNMHAQSYDLKIEKAVELVARNTQLPERWVLKTTAVKKLIAQHPPRHLMKQLHYRSAGSLIKRENMAEICLAAELIESPAWHKAHFKLAAQLDTTYFEMRQLKLQALTSRWGTWQSDDNLYVCNSDYGVLGIRPTVEVQTMSLLALVVIILDEIGARPSEAACLSPVAAWWSDTDETIAALNGMPVSFNLKDVALCQSDRAEFEARHRSAAQRHFWRNLLKRYENQLAITEDALPKLDSPVMNIRAPLNQPVFEYAEDV